MQGFRTDMSCRKQQQYWSIKSSKGKNNRSPGTDLLSICKDLLITSREKTCTLTKVIENTDVMWPVCSIRVILGNLTEKLKDQFNSNLQAHCVTNSSRSTIPVISSFDQSGKKISKIHSPDLLVDIDWTSAGMEDLISHC